MRQTVRDRLLELEGQNVVITTTSGSDIQGKVGQVGVDFVEINLPAPSNGLVMVALFHTEIVEVA